MKTTFISLSGFLLILSITTIQEDELIIGTWVSESDPSNKWVFIGSECLRYSQGKLLNKYSFKINNSSPQCEYDVPVNSNTSYLELTKRDNGSKFCYEIASLNDKYLTIRYLNAGRFMVFKRG
ncbi:hypothetical protein [Ekhidna sp.]